MSENHHDHHPSDSESEKISPANPQYWLSLEQWANDPEFRKFADQEFHSSPLREGKEDSVARRDFLKLMGASLALATASCIRRPAQKIVPYNKQPEEVTFGIPNYYTSTWFDGSEGFALWVKTREGRPIKIEGNPSSPLNSKGASARAQAHLLSLYDPERLRGPKRNLLNKERTNRDTIAIDWKSADDLVSASLKKGKTVLLTGVNPSPTSQALIGDFAKATGASHVTWQPITNEEVIAGQVASYGQSILPFYRFERAKMIVSVDADFLGTWLMPTTFARQYAEGRKDPVHMSRLVSFESNYSLTGANADIRYRIKPSQQVDVLMGLAYEIVVKKGWSKFAGNTQVKNALEAFANVPAKLGVNAEQFSLLAEDLWKNKGQSLVVCGGLAAATPTATQTQVAANFLNNLLENDGVTVDWASAPGYQNASYKQMIDLIEKMNAGQVKTLIIQGLNPGYALPAGFGFVEALKKVEMVVYFGDRNDETGVLSHLVLPANHSMESWSDAEFVPGVINIHQPTVEALGDTRPWQESLMEWAKATKGGGKRLEQSANFYEYLHAYWKEVVHPKYAKWKSFDQFWQDVLQSGVAGGLSASKSSSRTFKLAALSGIKTLNQEGLELVLYPTVAHGDGSMGNVSWLQELPDPVTKITWDNFALVSLALATEQGLKEGDVVKLSANGVDLEVPVHIQPGMHDQAIAVAVGFGRTRAGKVGDGVGSNAYALVAARNGSAVFSASSVKMAKTGKVIQLACTQGHQVMEGRNIAIVVNQSDYLANHAAGIHKHPIHSIWSGHEYKGHKWGMAVDLNTCTGCSACIVACQSENNIPIVGKKYVLEGREMHWLRVDRYYTGDPSNAQAVFQPVMCQQCDNAPCETVCPVLATVHSDEGLNDMSYNRCVGTRYCANNCPYKVRRFNWFNFTKNIEKPLNMALNPDVTVRSRGVMEKCTFCVQRIKFGKTQAKLNDQTLKDGDIKTACEQTCPTGALVFGDLNDKNSRVAKIFAEEKRSYGLIEEFNAAPAVRYATKIRNNRQSASKTHETHEKGGHV